MASFCNPTAEPLGHNFIDRSSRSYPTSGKAQAGGGGFEEGGGEGHVF